MFTIVDVETYVFSRFSIENYPEIITHGTLSSPGVIWSSDLLPIVKGLKVLYFGITIFF